MVWKILIMLAEVVRFGFLPFLVAVCAIGVLFRAAAWARERLKGG